MAATRKAISKKLRFDVFKRDGFSCQYCGAHPPQAILHVDHITPVIEGGGNNIDNLVTSCDACNLGKGARALSEIPQSLKDKASAIQEREEQIRGYNEVMMARVRRIENEAWVVAAALEGVECLERYDRADFLSIKRFLERLPAFRVLEAADIARAKCFRSDAKTFRYFCGVCWSLIREAEHA